MNGVRVTSAVAPDCYSAEVARLRARAGNAASPEALADEGEVGIHGKAES
jgi:hypothetical protein